jgi:thiol-disulfide isomerase/thioredoxin
MKTNFKIINNETKMIKLLRKLVFTFLFLGIMVSCRAQQYAYVYGIIENPIPAFVSLSYTKDYFTLKKGNIEMRLDSNNTFAFKIKLSDPQEFTFHYFTQSINLFLSPDDTLKLVFNGQNFPNSIFCEGSAAVQNRFLIDFQKQFKDVTDESVVLETIKSKSVGDFQKNINQLYTDKSLFLEKYDAASKKRFSKTFNTFLQQNLIYSKSWHLLNYFKTTGWIKTDNLPSTHFSFLKEININNEEALQNTNYLRFLELYLEFERYNIIKKKPRPTVQDVVLEKSRKILTFYRPLSSRLALFNNPFLSDSVICYMTFQDEMSYLNMASETRIRVETKNAIIEDVFLNVKNAKGQSGWIEQTLAQSYEKTVIEKEIYCRQCIDDKNPLCDYDRFLSGKVLMQAATRDLILGILEDSYQQAEARMKDFMALNKTHKNYNTLLQTVFDATMAVCQSGDVRLVIPTINTVENNENKENYDKILRGSYERFKQAQGERDNVLTARKNAILPSNGTISGESFINNAQNYVPYDALRQYQPDSKPNVFKGLVLNEKLPPFVVSDVNGKEIRQQNYLGKVVYLVFWATWCSPCQAHMTFSQNLIEKYKNKDVVFLYVSIDEETLAWKQYILDNKLKGIHVNDAVILPINCRIQGLPNFLIVDKNGVIAFNSLIQSKVTEEEILDFLVKDKKN